MKKSAAFALALAILVICVASCGNQSILGTWVCSYTEFYMGSKVEINVRMTFDENDTVSVTVGTSTVNKYETDTANYSFDGKTLIINGEKVNFKLDGDKLTIYSNGSTMNFTRE